MVKWEEKLFVVDTHYRALNISAYDNKVVHVLIKREYGLNTFEK